MGKSRVENKVYLFKYLLHLQKIYYSLNVNGIDYGSKISENLREEIKQLKTYLGISKPNYLGDEYTFSEFDLTIKDKPKV